MFEPKLWEGQQMEKYFYLNLSVYYEAWDHFQGKRKSCPPELNIKMKDYLNVQ
jgi:hypothetical protein